MSDSVRSFEIVLKEQRNKKRKTLYNNSKQQNKSTFTPQDVISSVSSQLKAIKGADSFKINKGTTNNLNKYKSSTYITVNNLPTYEQLPHPKQSKFDTQCVSDTQLLNVIEDAEIVDKYQGMTDAFETPFSQINTERQDHTFNKNNHMDENIGNIKCVSDLMAIDENSDNVEHDVGKENFMDKTMNPKHGDEENSDTVPHNIVNKNEDIAIETDILNNIIGIDQHIDTGAIDTQYDTQVDQLSQILKSKSLNNRSMSTKSVNTRHKTIIEDEHYSQIEEKSQILNQCQAIESDDDTDISPSLIFPNNNIKTKSKTPSPLVFNLDKFEHFENIAISLLEFNDYDTAKHIINSQILDKELHIKIDEHIELNETDISSPILQLKGIEERNLESPIIQLNKEIIEIDKATSEEILNQLTNQKSKNKIDDSIDVFKDEILFSSDEEEDYVHKELQDLPFTCALETSFYDQSHVLDKTMYVGFQTASNRSIQISADSFVKAKSLFSDVTNDEVTVTDLVKNCDNSLKNISKVEQNKCDNASEKELSPVCQIAVDSKMRDPAVKSQLKLSSKEMSPKNLNFMGFSTANNKKINLSEKSLARCKKVFQDIDLSQNFDTVVETEDLGEDLAKADKECAFTQPCCDNQNVENTKENINLVDDALQGIDDVIIQEFENIEMSLKDDNLPGKNSPSTRFYIAGDKISDDVREKMKDILKDIDFSGDLNENMDVNSNEKTEDVVISQIISNPKLKDETKISIGFKTASHKSIKISEEAWVKSKKVFEDIDGTESSNLVNKNTDIVSTEEPNNDQILANSVIKTTTNKHINISKNVAANAKDIIKDIDGAGSEYKYESINLPDMEKSKSVTGNMLNINQPSTSKGFVGFKTANNKAINISEKAWRKCTTLFNDIDSTELPKKTSKDYPQDPIKVTKNMKEDIVKTETNFVGFKTACNRNIHISKEALAKSKNIISDIDSADLLLPSKNYKRGIVTVEYKNQLETENKTIIKPTTSFIGFKSASDKVIKISDKALAQSKNIFEDIDSTELEFSVNSKKASKSNTDTIQPHSSEAKFIGFKTANNKVIKISKEALAKSKNVFNDIDSTAMKFPDKKQKDYPNTEELQDPYEKAVDNETAKGVQNYTNKKDEKDRDHAIATMQEVPQFQGFKPASNKLVKISSESLIKSRNIFKDIDSIDFKLPDKKHKDYPSFEEHDKLSRGNSSSGKLLESNSTHKEDGLDVTEEVPKFQGFKTASDKQVKVSRETLIKSKNIFRDIDHIENYDVTNKINAVKDVNPKTLKNTEERPNSPVFQGLQTANKNSVAISAKALEHSKKLFEDLHSFDKAGFSGFQTASNKQVKVSEKSLAKSRNIFKDLDRHDDMKAENKSIKQKALYPEEIYQREENDYVDEKNIFLGFQTGNNNVVEVSERALTETINLFDQDKCKSQIFKGFETASNKKVLISEEALAKTKKIFQDIETTINEIQEGNSKTGMNFKMACQTGNSNPIAVSNEALVRSKRLFAEIDDRTKITPNKKEKIESATKTHKTDEIHSIIDTQVINNFDESLHTEDFHDTPRKSKRSGSPILSCPRAKKRKKFETPYNVKKISVSLPKTTDKPKDEKKLIFREDYKKNKKYTLKDVRKITKDNTFEIDPYLFNFDFDSLLQFEFKNNRNDLTSDNLSIDSLKEEFLNSVDAKLVPDGWLENHLKLILWKLISYEINFKCLMCTARNVIDQLKYRYDKELYNAQRPALRKMFEKDDVPSKTIVLCVVAIYVDGCKVSSVTDCLSNMELLLTDGWYCIRCVIDKMLTQLVCSKKIAVGSKIVTSGAELSGCEQGVAPWEDTSAVRLKIFGNSTCRARWDARLGYHGNGAILSQLSTVTVLGGKIAKLRVFIARVYPALYVEKFEDGSTVTRSERLENLHQMKTEGERQSIMEKIYEEVELEFSDKNSQDSEGLTDSCRRTCMESGSQIAKMMKRSKDPAEFRAQLSSSQCRLLEAHTSRNRDRLLQDIQTRVRERIEIAGVGVNRNVVNLLKIRVVGVMEKGERVDVCKGMMSIWKPNEGIREIVREGTWIDVLNVVPTAFRYSEIQISAGRQSIFSASKFKPPEKFQPYIKLLQRQCYSIKDLAQNPAMSTDYNEIDTIGLIFLIDPSIENFDSSKQSFQNVYLTDIDKNMVCVNFWGGLKQFGFQNVLDTGQVVSCVNLQKRAGNSRKTITQYRVTELSYFTQTPKSDSARKMLQELNKKLTGLDRRKFCQECVVLKNNYSVLKQNNENVSPYRFMNNSEINMSKNKMFIDSPLARNNKIDDNFNLTGLDFESTFKQDSELSEEALKRKRKVNEKIARLKMYGEPPPLSPLHIINRSKHATSSYKSPLLPNNNNSSLCNNQKSLNDESNLKSNDSDSSINVASAQNTPHKCGDFNPDVSKSPVLNRTYVKSVNPVKINFDVKDNNDSNIDHFADEFDGSPPLSLD